VSGGVLFDSLIKPRVPISETARRIHGISGNDVVNASSFDAAWPRIKAAINGRLVEVALLGRVARGPAPRKVAVLGERPS